MQSYYFLKNQLKYKIPTVKGGVAYVALSEQDLPLFYRAMNFLREERSIVYITNRELSEWTQIAEDKHLMETLIQKITSGSQLIRL